MESQPSLQNPVLPEITQPRPLLILPAELIGEILTWLPVDSLLRFRCVSKWFKTLISSSDFVKAHLRSMKALSIVKPNRAERLIRQSWNFIERQIEPHPFEHLFERRPRFIRRKNKRSRVVDWGSHLSSLESLYNDPQTDLVELGEMFDRERSSYGYDSVVGSCDGLLCSVIEPHYYVAVWNPSTRAFRALPDYECDETDSEEKWIPGSYMVFGFGYDCLHDDYKVVAVLIYPHANGYGSDGIDGTRYRTFVQVFALKTKTWRKIEDFQYGAPADGRGRFAAGCLHFLVPVYCGAEGNPECKDAIVALDLATEKYSKVELPNFDEAPTHWELEVLVDRLCALGYYNDGSSSCAVWVMAKEAGEKESWTKLFRFAQDEVRGSLRSLVYISDNGEVLLETYADLIMYNCKDGTVRYPASRGSIDRDGSAVIYMESLVSPEIKN